MRALSKTCVVLVVLLSGCGLQTPSGRQKETNQRLDQIHKDLQQIHRDLQRRP